MQKKNHLPFLNGIVKHGELVMPGDILLIALPSHHPEGYEQEGVRPAIVAGIPRGVVRYPILIMIPLTTQCGSRANKNRALYPSLSPGDGGLSKTSIALIDQVRAVDVKRVKSYLGTLESGIFESIRKNLINIFEGE